MEEMKFFKPSRFAKLIDSNRSTIYELIKRGDLRAVKIGGNLRIPASELDRLARAAESEPD